MQNVAEHHEIVLSRFPRRDFLNVAANESDIVKRTLIQAADPGRDVDSGDLGVGIGRVQPLRYCALTGQPTSRILMASGFHWRIRFTKASISR